MATMYCGVPPSFLHPQYGGVYQRRVILDDLTRALFGEKVYEPYPSSPGSPSLIEIRPLGPCACGCGMNFGPWLKNHPIEVLQYYARKKLLRGDVK